MPASKAHGPDRAAAELFHERVVAIPCTEEMQLLLHVASLNSALSLLLSSDPS